MLWRASLPTCRRSIPARDACDPARAVPRRSEGPISRVARADSRPLLPAVCEVYNLAYSAHTLRLCVSPLASLHRLLSRCLCRHPRLAQDAGFRAAAMGCCSLQFCCSLHPFRMARRVAHALHFTLSDCLNSALLAGPLAFRPILYRHGSSCALAQRLARSTCGVLPCERSCQRRSGSCRLGQGPALKRTVALASVPDRRSVSCFVPNRRAVWNHGRSSPVVGS